MVALTMPFAEYGCYKCKVKDGAYIMSDKKLTKGVFKRFCRGCYFELFKKEK